MPRRQSSVAPPAPPSLRARLAPSLTLFVACLFAVPLAHADSRTYRNAAMKVRAFTPPVGWESQSTGSYARLLAVWTDKEGGKLTLVAARTAAATAKALADESRAALVRQGFKSVVETPDRSLMALTAPTGDVPRLRLDAQLDESHRFARQLYLVSDGIGYVVTLIGPAVRAAQLRRDFDDAVATLELGVDAHPDDGGATDEPPRPSPSPDGVRNGVKR